MTGRRRPALCIDAPFWHCHGVLDAEDNSARAVPTPVAAPRRRLRIADPAALAAFAAVAAATIYLSFNAGGFFVFPPALLAVLLLIGLLLHATLAREPFAGLSTAGAAAVGGLALFAVWTLASALWSDAPARAMIEFDRALLYVAALLLAVALPHSPSRLRAMLAGLTVAAGAVAVIALITRLLPEVWPLAPNVSPDRLSYPLTYWNALGLLAGFGLVGALHFAASARTLLPVRLGATALIPVQVAVLYFTLSRGPMAVTAAGVLLYLLLARPRGALMTLAAALPASAAVVLAGYGADALTSERPTVGAAIDQGHTVALVLAGGVVATVLLRLALLPLERRLRLPRARLPVPGWAAALVAVAVAVGLLFASGLVQRVVDDFGDSYAVSNLGDERQRLFSASNNGRFDHWKVAIDAFESRPLVGTGAGTYELEWARERPYDFTVIHAHSLYAQVLGELGVVGLALLLTALAALAVGLIRRLRGPDRALVAAVAAPMAMWLVHAGIDWDWEIPAVTLWLFALCGAAVAAPRGTQGEPSRSWVAGRTPRLLIGLGCLLLAVTPALLGLSQRQLDRAAAAFDRLDCPAVIDHGLASISLLGVRPQPYALVGLCDVRLGANALGIEMLRKAIARDPHDWSYRYALAIAQAATGRDPRAAARRAHQLNPLDPRARYALQLYGDGDPRGWRARALEAPSPW